DYELYYESKSNPRIGISFRLSPYHETTSIIFSCPKSTVLGSVGIEYDGYYKWVKSRKDFFLEEIFKKFKEEIFLKQQITEKKLSDILKQSASFTRLHLLPVIRGEKWIDEIVEEYKQKNGQD